MISALPPPPPACPDRNEAEVGEALHAAMSSGRVSRCEVFLTSKLWNSDHGRVREACARTLRNLRVDRLDLYLVHWMPKSDEALLATWRQMEALVKDGLVTSIGLSNCPLKRLRTLLAASSPPLQVRPSVNQIECHPGWRNEALRAFCASMGIHVTAHTALGGGTLLKDAKVIRAAEGLGVPPSQLLLRWALSRGCSAVFRSREAGRIQEAAQVQVVVAAASSEGAEGGAVGGAVGDELDALALVPQERKAVGSSFVTSGGSGGSGGKRSTSEFAYGSLQELWGEPEDE